MSFFESILPSKSIMTDSDELLSLNTDWQKRWKGNS